MATRIEGPRGTVGVPVHRWTVTVYTPLSVRPVSICYFATHNGYGWIRFELPISEWDKAGSVLIDEAYP